LKKDSLFNEGRFLFYYIFSNLLPYKFTFQHKKNTQKLADFRVFFYPIDAIIF